MVFKKPKLDLAQKHFVMLNTDRVVELNTDRVVGYVSLFPSHYEMPALFCSA